MSRLKSWQLFALCVLTWGTTWHAITYQLGHTSPEYGVALRFALAGGTVLLLCAWRGERWRLPLADHALLALQGAFMYGLSYLCVYHAERYLPSGVVAVGYSASPLLSGIGALLLFGIALTRRFIWGGVLGLMGVALILWPEFGTATLGGQGGRGAAFAVAAVMLATVGSLIASRNRHRGLPFWPCLGWGMGYGALVCFGFVLALGQPLALPTAGSWWASLVYLALAGSALTFACYLTLLDRLGPGPAGAIGVMTPLLALGVSVALEGYRPDLFTAAGAALAVVGNLLMLRRGTAPAAAQAIRPAAAAKE
jgi:drug/metabolite transporter (DMT)-like permease